MLHTRLGIQFPILQAPMAGAQASALAIAVCGAGGLGALPCAMLTRKSVRDEVSKIRAAATDRPFNLNFFCHTPPTVDVQRESRWRALLSPAFQEFGIDPHGPPARPGRNPFTAEDAALVEELRPPVVSFHFGLPASDLLHRVKATGALVLSSATTVGEARWLEQHGVDAIIAQGSEAGGHRGIFLTKDLTTQSGTFALVPQVVAAVKVPVIAAGGIADAAGVRAAFALGASAVQVGTAYLLCHESQISLLHRAALISPAAEHTALTNLFTGRPARGIVNRFMRDYGPMNEAAPEFPLAISAMTPLRAAAEKQGSSDFSPLWCGQNARGCRAISAADLTRALMTG